MIKRITFLLLVLAFQLGFSQSEKLTSKDVSKIISKAREHFSKLECDKSLDFAKKALNEAYKIGDNVLIAKSYNLIGLNFYEFSDYKKAIDFYNKGIYYADLCSNDTLKKNLYNNLGNVYCFRKIDVKKGIESYKKSLYFAFKIKDEFEINYVRLNLASAYFGIGDYKNGYPYLKSIQKYFEESDELEAKLSMNSLFGDYYSNINENTKAEASYKEALRLCNENKNEYFETYTCEVYDDFARFYFKIKDYKNAYLYLDKYNKLNQKLYNKEKTESVQKTGLNVELDEYKRQINKIELEKNIQNQNLRYSKIVVILFVAVFAILILLSVTFFKNDRYKKKINNDLVIANQELKIAKEKAEEVSKLKTQFVSTISHELRTPLYGVVGIANIILEEHKELKDSPYLNSLKFSARYLLSLVNDILHVNKIEENRVELESQPFNITDKINNILNSLQFLANKSDNKLESHIDSAIPEILIGDKLRFSQILMNLVSNALKFTKKGKVKISAELVKVEGNINYIKIEVKDNGIGIAKENQEKIFEKFVQVNRKEDDYQGTGLGLSIVKKLVELFGSEIHLESEEGIGTTFTFTIGFESDITKLNNIINGFELDLSTSPISVLVIEDNKINQMVTRKILESNSFKCEVVGDGYLALKLLEETVFDVILMDLNMPIINGFETSKKIRGAGIKTPIIALTAFSRDEVLEEINSSGMNDIIVKPFEPKQLFQVIINQINKNKKR